MKAPFTEVRNSKDQSILFSKRRIRRAKQLLHAMVEPLEKRKMMSTSATAVSSTQVYLSWSWSGASDSNGYEIAAADSSSSYTSYTTVGAAYSGATSALVKGLKPSDSYSFHIYAVSSTGSTLDADVPTATTPGSVQLSGPATYNVSGTITYEYTASSNLSGAVYSWNGTDTSNDPVSFSGTTSTLSTTTVLNSLTVDVTTTVGGSYVGGSDSMTEYAYAPTAEVTGTSASNLFGATEAANSAGNDVYTVTGSNVPIAPFIAPGVNLNLQGRGGNDALSIGSGANVTVVNDAGSDGTVLTVNAASGSHISFASTEHLNALNLSSGSAGYMAEDGDYVLVLNRLSIAGTTSAWTSSLDLADNDMIVRDSASWSPSYPANVEAIYQQIQNGAIYSTLSQGIFLRNNSTPGTFCGESVSGTDALVQNIGGYGWGMSNYYGSAYGWIDSTWGTPGVSFTPSVYSTLPSNTVWQVDWGDGTHQTITGSTPGSHSYNISEGNVFVGMTAYSGGSYYYSPGTVIYAPPEYALAIDQTSTPSLPAPTQYTFTTPTGADTFSPPVTSATVSGSAPEIDQGNNNAAPGDVITLTVENYNASSTTFWVYGQTTSGNATLALAPIKLDSTDNTSGSTSGTTAVSIQLPTALPANSAYFIWANNGSTFGLPFIVNQPQISWDSVNNVHADQPLSTDYTSDPSAFAGEKVSLFGQNLSLNVNQQPYSDQSWVCFFNTSSPGVSPVAILPVTAEAPDSTGANAVDVNPYKVDFTVPSTSTLPTGTYDVEVFNGHGGTYGLSNWVQISVGSAPTAGPSFSLSYALSQWNVSNTPVSLYVPLPDNSNITSINPIAVNDAIQWAAGQTTGYSYVTLDLSSTPGIIEITPTSGMLEMLPGVHMVGAGDNTSNLSAGTTVEGEPGMSVQGIIDITNYSAVSLSNMYVRANDDLVGDYYGHMGVLYCWQTGSGLTLDDVTVDGRDSTGTGAALDLIYGNVDTHDTFLNSTFIGGGVAVPGGADLIIDNCQFFVCGEQYGSAAAIFSTEGGNDISVTRCTEKGLVDDIANPGGDIVFDAASRLLITQGSAGFTYVGDNTTTDLYETPTLDENGGEQVLVEGYNGYTSYTGGVNASSGPVTGFTSTSVTFDGGVIAGEVLITAGPGMGEFRTIFSDGSLNMPWTVVPTSASQLVISQITSSVTVYQNTLNGDGAFSMLANDSGVLVGGLNLTIDGNDISNVANGIAFWDGGGADTVTVNSFNLYARNAIHNVAVGIGIGAGYGNSTPISWFIRNDYRSNIISGLDFGNYYQPIPAAISIASGSGSSDPAQILNNVIDQNIITDAHIGIQFVFSNGTSSNGSAGIMNTVLSNDFFSSDGSISSIDLTTYNFATGSRDLDADPYFEFGDSWQNFWVNEF